MTKEFLLNVNIMELIGHNNYVTVVMRSSE
jgi:hypothetical protein